MLSMRESLMVFHVKIGITGKQRGNQYAEIEGQLVTS